MDARQQARYDQALAQLRAHEESHANLRHVRPCTYCAVIREYMRQQQLEGSEEVSEIAEAVAA
jgi:hypothetical protein